MRKPCVQHLTLGHTLAKTGSMGRRTIWRPREVNVPSESSAPNARRSSRALSMADVDGLHKPTEPFQMIQASPLLVLKNHWEWLGAHLSMKSKFCGCCTFSCLSCSISEVRLTLCISGTVAAGRDWKVSSLYNLKATPGPSRPVQLNQFHQYGAFFQMSSLSMAHAILCARMHTGASSAM